MAKIIYVGSCGSCESQVRLYHLLQMAIRNFFKDLKAFLSKNSNIKLANI